ncbi:TolC family outer membrane protein [Sphingomonas qomolangmaensis]|uniref:TolC family outer membrane protein n=1 Tax=Sphingomonas qomolangmaensis TaxID=2918765 RepID=A0ABY5LDI8_9SPHN|nr:TolC family outer membrane protein [Sphingomonas qomolangmaensis]UUL83748.1 TolC family outer membrane protein [Sphingomonas qomolangmaensis]
MALASAAQGQTLREALVEAYNENPNLAGERANLRAIDEGVPLARADALPSLGVQGNYIEALIQQQNSFLAPNRSLSTNLNASYPLYQGGRVKNSVAAAKTRVLAGRANLRSAEANLFTQVVATYNDVIRDEAIVQLNQQNVRGLEVNLTATRDRFEVGDVTRTDVAQSEARLALAVGQLRSAEAALIGSRESYVEVVGSAPQTLAPPPPLPNLPGDPQAAVVTALNSNPQLQAAERNRDAAGLDVRVARASRLPTVDAVSGGNYFNYFGSSGGSTVGTSIPQSGTSAQAGLSFTVPLYQGGRPAAQVRQAQARQGVAIEQVTATERGIISQARTAFANWQSSLRVIEASEAAVDANRLSLEGVRAENSVGNRTIIEILNAEQELLNSQVQLVTARRDAYVAGFALLAAMGRAEANDLGLDGGALYDPLTNYERVDKRWIDWDSDPTPQPVGSRTVDVVAQTPIVNKTLEPDLQRPVDTDPANPSGGVNTPR